MSGANRTVADGALRTGELAALTAATPRMLRHYENHGLIEAKRSSTGQRRFAPAVVEQVRAIRRLIGAGLSVGVIGELLDCIVDADRLEPCAVPLLVEHLQAHNRRIAELTTTRDALQGLIDTTNR